MRSSTEKNKQYNNDLDKSPREDVLCGRNSVMEALRSGRQVDCVYIAGEEKGGILGKITAMALDLGVPVKHVSAKKLDFMCGNASHQNVAAIFSAAEYVSVEDILKTAEEKGESPFVVVCDGIEDPHNLGAIIRTAEATGVHGIIVGKRRSASLTASAAKAASGALEYVPVARVSNLASTIDMLKEKGLWVYAAHMEGENYKEVDYSGGCALIIGGEGSGVSRLSKEKCDKLVSLPMKGKINSLNASVAAGILMYEISTGR